MVKRPVKSLEATAGPLHMPEASFQDRVEFKHCQSALIPEIQYDAVHDRLDKDPNASTIYNSLYSSNYSRMYLFILSLY